MTESLQSQRQPLAPVAAKTEPPKVLLRLLATSDLHMHLAAYDYHSDMACHRKGLAMTASLIAAARQEVANSVLLDNGDFLQGSPLGDFVAQTRFQPHPMIQAMNHLHYDVVNLGNHEFSHGVDTLMSALAEARFDCLSANTLPTGPAPTAPFLPPWAIVTRDLPDQHGRLHPVRLGVIGVLPPETEVWDKQAIAGRFRMTPMTETVAQHLPALRAAGADVVVVLAHCGLGSAYDGNGLTDGAAQIAALADVDAIVMGHEHMVFPGPDLSAHPAAQADQGLIHGKPAVMPGFFGSHLGVIDLSLVREDGAWRVSGQQVAARPIVWRDDAGVQTPTVQPDPAILALVEPAHRATFHWARQPIGHFEQPIHSYFALVTDSAALQIVNRAQAQYVHARLKDSPLGHLPVLSAAAPFKAGGRGGPDNFSFIPAGDVALRHAADLYTHPNTLTALRLTGAEVTAWLERSVSIYRQITPGLSDQPLVDPNVPTFLCDTISGLTYEIDLTAPSILQGGQRIRRLCWQGRPLDPAQDFILATNSYRGSGSGGFAQVDSGRIVLADRTANRDILIAYVSAIQTGAAQPFKPAPPGWRFVPVPDTSVLFETSPAAAALVTCQDGLRMQPLGPTPAGFLRVRLFL